MARSDRRATRCSGERGAARTSLGVLLAGLAGVTILLAGPAGAQTTRQTTGQSSGGALAVNDSVASGTCVATNDSTCSGSGRADDDSTSSGSAVAVDGSVSSGCATAINDSTASGAPCPAPATIAPPRTAGPTPPVRGTGGATTARPAAASASPSRSLALTGFNNGELAGAGALALLAGAMLVRAGRKDDATRTA